MSNYAKKTWQDGEIITDEALNEREKAIEEAFKLVEETLLKANADTRVQFVNDVLQTLGGTAIPTGKTATGSYIGTGTSQQEAQHVLTFDFEPSFIIIYSLEKYIWMLKPRSYPVDGVHGNAFIFNTSSYFGVNGYGSKSSDGKTVSVYYNGSSADLCMNTLDRVYYYTAFA